MNAYQKLHVKWTLSFLSTLVLALFLVACGNNSVVATTLPPSVPGYVGQGFTVNYPEGWIYTEDDTGVTFTTSNNPTTTLTISAIPGDASTSRDTYLTDTLNTLETHYLNYQEDDTTATGLVIGKEPWKGVIVTGDKDGQHLKSVVLADEHPADIGPIFAITLTATVSNYDRAYSTSFKSILDSFVFSGKVVDDGDDKHK